MSDSSGADQGIKRLHHINFLVRDLELSLPRFCALLDAPRPETERLEGRGVKLARFQLGETWLILVQPVDETGVPAQYLKRHGEGFFLASFQVESLEQASARMTEAGLGLRDSQPRQGLDDWLVMDLEPGFFNGIELQLVQTEN